MITQFEAEVLFHASSNGRYVTNDSRVLAMAESGLLRDYGAQPLAGGDHYLVTTPAGRQALNEWKAAQPVPKRKRRRRSRQFQAWRDYDAANGRLGFRDFLLEVWPICKSWPQYTS